MQSLPGPSGSAPALGVESGALLLNSIGNVLEEGQPDFQADGGAGGMRRAHLVLSHRQGCAYSD
ncbi:hypothetical protein [Roseiflexus sp.]|uniref:hypothetical protein n=1 Tax=Roseiflexus sp. TaxID=2562120 RepID=UPI00398A7993